MFLPTTQAEARRRGWERLDVILITGDAYIDSPHIGVAVIANVLADAGYRVGIIAQPDTGSDADITRLGEPELCWGVTAGCIDSMVANYTATKKKRRQDDYTPGGRNTRRPDRACIAYTNLIRRFFKKTRPIVLGGLEASLRRITHYDFWSNRVRRSILFDAKADLLVYGMAEQTMRKLCHCLKNGQSYKDLRGLCYSASTPRPGYNKLPSYKKAAADKQAFSEMFTVFYNNNDPQTAQGLCQQQDARYLIQNPPPPYLSPSELDRVYGLRYERALHPACRSQGAVRALDTIQFSIATHRGCYGECSFCAIALHQGRTVRWRSRQSILAEARRMTRHPDFKGVIQDVGGPTANMYGYECRKKITRGACRDKRCLFPAVCDSLKPDHSKQLALLKQLRGLEGVKHVFVASGLRYDLLLADGRHAERYLRELAAHHVSGQLKVAPEHVDDRILALMGKPDSRTLLRFKERFTRASRTAGKKQFLTYYLVAAHPGCREQEMRTLKSFAVRELKTTPEQVQIFTPTPSTMSTLMYYTETDPANGRKLFVEKSTAGKERQKKIIVPQAAKQWRKRPNNTIRERNP
ncbi:MAG: YgiQ family radical SAM protein [Deltaproteobacteria bacterium]|nr:YgiQ family radical SAM protein [Deltaproteobacteria bacterium]